MVTVVSEVGGREGSGRRRVDMLAKDTCLRHRGIRQRHRKGLAWELAS